MIKTESILDNMDLVRKIAWSFHRTTGIELQELISEATLQYLRAVKTYDQSAPRKVTTPRGLPKCSVTSYAWCFITKELTTFCKLEGRMIPTDMEKNHQFVSEPLAFFELYDSLPRDCKVLADIVLSDPLEYAGIMPKFARGKVIKVLRERGWSWSKIWGTVKKMKQALNETPENCIIKM